MENYILSILSKFKNRGIQVISFLLIYFLFANDLPLIIHEGLYTISLFIKDLLIWMMPITVGLFIAQAICSFQTKAPLFIGVLVLFVALSNFASVWYAYWGGELVVDYLPITNLPESNQTFNALWSLPFAKPSWWSADKGTFVGIACGLLATFTKNSNLQRMIEIGKTGMQWILTHIFSRLIPIFVLGFVARMHQTRALQHVFAHYGILLICLVLFLLMYLGLLFFISNKCSFKGLASNIKNLLPAGAIAFTSGCSLSTMPWTIEGAGKNLKNPDLAKSVIPATTNIQQIGDCITNTFLCFLIYRHFFDYNPDLSTWLSFSIMFVFARFATAAVLGGAIFIMLPIYESYLSFNAEMIAIILAFNVVLDPIITSCNVIANGALCRLFENVWSFFTKTKPESLPVTSG